MTTHVLDALFPVPDSGEVEQLGSVPGAAVKVHCTVPVGVALPTEPVTVEVKVTDWPGVGFAGKAGTVTLGVVELTVTVSYEEVGL